MLSEFYVAMEWGRLRAADCFPFCQRHRIDAFIRRSVLGRFVQPESPSFEILDRLID